MNSSWVSQIELTNFRGLVEAKLEGLAPLTVLTGRNGCGKSTVLEGLFIGVSSDPASALGQVATRRRNTPNAARWLFNRGQIGSKAHLAPSFEGKVQYRRGLSASNASASRIEILDGPTEKSSVRFDGDGKFSATSITHQGKVVRLIDASEPSADLAIALSNLRGQVFRGEVDEMIGVLLPGAVRLEISIPERNVHTVEVTFRDYAVPLSVAGDGIQAAVQLAVELSQIPEGGLALIEEPEVFLHPGALLQVTKVLLRTMRRGVQVVLSTHSLDLIDALVEVAAADTEREMLALFRLRLVDGKLHLGRYGGSEIAFARFEIAEDLR